MIALNLSKLISIDYKVYGIFGRSTPMQPNPVVLYSPHSGATPRKSRLPSLRIHHPPSISIHSFTISHMIVSSFILLRFDNISWPKYLLSINQAYHILSPHRWFSGKISRCHLYQINSASPGFDSRPMQSLLFAVLGWSGGVVVDRDDELSLGGRWGNLVGDTIDLSMPKRTIRMSAVLVLGLIHFAIILRLWWWREVLKCAGHVDAAGCNDTMMR